MQLDTAPWTGRLRTAIASLQCLIFLATITAIAVGAASSALIQRQWNLPYLEGIGQSSLPETSYASTHEMKVRMSVRVPATMPDLFSNTDAAPSQLVCFYTLAPLVLLASIATEAHSLLTNNLSPLYVVLASPFSVLIWTLELTFWTVCRNTSGVTVPDLCPVIFKNGKDELFTLSDLGVAQASAYIAAAIIAL